MEGDEAHQQEHRHRAHRPAGDKAVRGRGDDAEGRLEAEKHGDAAEGDGDHGERHGHAQQEQEQQDADTIETDVYAHA